MISSMDVVLLHDWHPVAEVCGLPHDRDHATRLLGVPLLVRMRGREDVCVLRAIDRRPVIARIKYGHVWACLGTPEQDVIDIPEVNESDRCRVTGGSLGIAASGLRVVENFFDMAHFPFVHTNYLGVEPYTEVLSYQVHVSPTGIRTTNCRFYQTYQPAGAPPSGDYISYEYRVLKPYMVGLFKANPTNAERKDCVILFVQPVDEESCIAHSWLAYVPDGVEEGKIRWFMQLIMAQDKAILENQLPKRLPLSLRTERSLSCDALSIAYRRWLRDLKITYGAIQADE